MWASAASSTQPARPGREARRQLAVDVEVDQRVRAEGDRQREDDQHQFDAPPLARDHRDGRGGAHASAVRLRRPAVVLWRGVGAAVGCCRRSVVGLPSGVVVPWVLAVLDGVARLPIRAALGRRRSARRPSRGPIQTVGTSMLAAHLLLVVRRQTRSSPAAASRTPGTAGRPADPSDSPGRSPPGPRPRRRSTGFGSTRTRRRARLPATSSSTSRPISGRTSRRRLGRLRGVALLVDPVGISSSRTGRSAVIVVLGVVRLAGSWVCRSGISRSAAAPSTIRSSHAARLDHVGDDHRDVVDAALGERLGDQLLHAASRSGMPQGGLDLVVVDQPAHAVAAEHQPVAGRDRHHGQVGIVGRLTVEHLQQQRPVRVVSPPRPR